MNYKMIRGPKAQNRCTNKGTYGSPLYCKCGCQEPRDGDPILNLSEVKVERQANYGYADFILTRNGQDCGYYNSQYGAIYMEGHEFLGVDGADVAHLLQQVRNDDYKPAENKENHDNAGTTLEETASIERALEIAALTDQDQAHKHHPGYCTKCHTYCYGDCDG